MIVAYSFTVFISSISLGDLFVVKVGKMNESLSFPVPIAICIVLLMSLSALLLAAHVPDGLVPSPRLPGLARTLMQVEEVLVGS